MTSPWTSRGRWSAVVWTGGALVATLVASVGVVAVYGPVAAPAPHARGGADSPDDAVNAYIAALNGNDTVALRRLAPDCDAGDTEDTRVEAHLRTHGGRDIRLTHRFIPGEVDHRVAARVDGLWGGGQPYEERLTLRHLNDRWYISLPQQTTA